MSRDELIRRAMMHARHGYAFGGKPGESAMAQAEANRNFGASPSRPASDNGFRSSPIGGGNAGADRLGGGSQISNTLSRTERANVLENPAGAAARLGPNAAMAMRDAGVSPDTAIRGAMSLNRSGAPANERMAPLNTGTQINPTAAVMNYGQNVRTPDMMSVTEATAPKSPLLDPNRFTFTNYGIMSGMQPEVLANLIKTQEYYGKPIGVTSGYRSPEHNEAVDGADQSQHLVGGAVDLMGALRNPMDTAALINAGIKAGFTGRGAYMKPGSVHLDIGPPRAWGPDYTSGTIGRLPKAVQDALNQRVQAAAPAPAAPAPVQNATYTGPLPRPRPVPSIGQVKSADATAMANSIQSQYAKAGIPISSEMAGQLAVGSMTTTGARQIVTDIKNKMAYTNTPEFQALPAAQRAAYQASVNKQMEEAMGVLGLSPANNAPGSSGFAAFESSLDPAFSGPTYGMTVNPQGVATAPGYNVFGPYNLTTEKGKTYPAGYIGFSDTAKMATANPNYGQMPAAPAAVAQEPQNITPPGLNNPQQLGPSPAAFTQANPAPQYYSAPVQNALNVIAQGNPAPQYYSSPLAPVQVAGSPSYAPQGNFAPEYYSAPYVAGVAPPVQVAEAPAPAPVTPVATAPKVTQNFVARPIDEFGRSGGDRDRSAAIARDNTQKLLALGYTKEQIAAMTPEQIKEILKGKTPAATPPAATTPATPAPVVAANGGRIQYKRGGGSEGESETTKSPSTGTGYEPISLPAMPEYKPYTLPQYTIPSASPMISSFMGSLSQPIPPVQMPQYQSMVSPLQNTQASFVNPAMGTASSSSTPGAGFGVNALRYNPMLMDERPDYALTGNDSISNALRLMRG
jgi:hypothetical protein